MGARSFFSFLLAVGLAGFSRGSDTMLTFELASSKEECFYEDVKKGVQVEVDWQVIAGGDDSQTAVYPRVYDATGREINVPRVDSMYHEFIAGGDGTVKVCFLNLQTFGPIWVFFDLGVDRANDDDDDFGDIGRLVDPAVLAGKQQTQESLDRLKTAALKVHQKLTSVIRAQSYLRYREAKHRHTAESNSARVMYWSMLSCTVMVVVGAVQVYFIQHFFAEPKGKINY